MKKKDIPDFIAAIEKLRNGATDEQAAECAFAYAEWKPDTEYKAGVRLQFNGHLYKVKDGKAHKSQADWTPDVTASLYERIARPDETGTQEHPIEYSGNMELFAGKYYRQNNVIYVCTRDSEIALVHPLSQLIGLYVEMVA